MAIILHVDMDCFFAAVEERENPEYAGKSLIIGADPAFSRGVVSTCNYPARTFGVHSAMPISKAYRLCPDGIYVRPRFELYSKVSRKLKMIFKTYASVYESGGIDEAYLDISYVGDYERALDVARRLQKHVFEAEKLTCSVGVGPNTLVAKVASDFQKPNGITVVREEDAAAFLAPLPVRKLLGVGPRTEEKLNELGITTVGQLQTSDSRALSSIFGKHGRYLHAAACGIGSTHIGGHHDVKSIGAQRTFFSDTRDTEKILSLMGKLCAELVEQARDQSLCFKTVTIVVRYEDFATFNKSFTLKFATDDEGVLFRVVRKLSIPFFQDSRKIRLIGVRVTQLYKMEEEQERLGNWMSNDMSEMSNRKLRALAPRIR